MRLFRGEVDSFVRHWSFLVLAMESVADVIQLVKLMVKMMISRFGMSAINPDVRLNYGLLLLSDLSVTIYFWTSQFLEELSGSDPDLHDA